MNEPRASLRALVAHVSSSESPLQGITYGQLAESIGRLNKHGKGHGHGMGSVLGKMGHLLESIEDEWGDSIPHIQSLVVNKTGTLKGLPDEGIKEFWNNYPNLTKLEKAHKSQAEYIKIRNFGSRWNKVLELLEIPQIDVSLSKTPEIESNHFGKGGESEEHIALKNFIAANPNLVGAEHTDGAFTEYVLPSLDTIDVVFKGPSRWTLVEVKSRISDHLPSDYERGLYQCVKYRAIVEAMKQDEHYLIPSKIEVVLVLESSLPEEYRALADSIQAKVIENLKPSHSLSS